MKKLIIILLVVSSVASFNQEKIPEGIVGKKKMADMIVDIHLADAIGSQRYSLGLVRDSLNEDLYLSVCKKNSVDPLVFEKSLHFYGRHPEVYTKVYDMAMDRLNALEVQARQEQDEARKQPDDVASPKPVKPARDSSSVLPRERPEIE